MGAPCHTPFDVIGRLFLLAPLWGGVLSLALQQPFLVPLLQTSTNDSRNAHKRGEGGKPFGAGCFSPTPGGKWRALYDGGWFDFPAQSPVRTIQNSGSAENANFPNVFIMTKTQLNRLRSRCPPCTCQGGCRSLKTWNITWPLLGL